MAPTKSLKLSRAHAAPPASLSKLIWSIRYRDHYWCATKTPVFALRLFSLVFCLFYAYHDKLYLVPLVRFAYFNIFVSMEASN